MYHKPRMCRTCLQMMRGDFKFVNLDETDPLWESNSPNLKDQLVYIVPEMKLENAEAYICTSCFIALRTAYEFKRMCQVTEQKFQSYNYKYRRPFGVGPGSPQFHVTLNENSTPVPNYRCQNLNYLQTDTSIDITEHHLYDASKVLPRKQLAYLSNVTQKLPEIDVEVILGQANAEKQSANVIKEAIDDKDNKKVEDKLKLDVKESVVEKKDTIEKKEEKIDLKEDNIETQSEKDVPVGKKDITAEEIEIPVAKKDAPVEKKDLPVQKKEIEKKEKDIPLEHKEKEITLEKKEVTLAKKEVTLEKKEVTLEKKEVTLEKKEVSVEKKEVVLDKKEITIAKKDITVEKKEKTSEKKEAKEGKVERELKNEKKDSKVELRLEKKEDPLTKNLKADLKSGNTFTLPNLPGIEIVPRKLDSSALRKKYNIGSQISILKTPKSSSGVDPVVTKACEEITYLKSNNIAPDALNCSVRIENLSSEITMKHTKDKYSLNEMKAIANAYYSGCSDNILSCKSCDRSFSTSYWFKIHEEEHIKQKKSEQFKCTVCSQSCKDAVSLENHAKIHLVPEKSNVTLEAPKSLINAINTSTKDISIPDVNKVKVPLLDNDQISLTPIPKDKKLNKTASTPDLVKTKEEINVVCNKEVKDKSIHMPEQAEKSDSIPDKETVTEPPSIINEETVEEPKSITNIVSVKESPPKPEQPKLLHTDDKDTVDKVKPIVPVKVEKTKKEEKQITPEISEETRKEEKQITSEISEETKKEEKQITREISEETKKEVKQIISEITENAKKEEQDITSVSTLALPSLVENIDLQNEENSNKVKEEPIQSKKSFNPSLFSEQLSTSIVNYISKSDSQESKTEPIVKKLKKKKLKAKSLKRHLKSIFKKKIPHLKYVKCYVCCKVFKSKLCLYQHCKFLHIPSVSHSRYWSNIIKAQREKRVSTKKIEPIAQSVEQSNAEIADSEEFVTPSRTAKSNRAVSHICNICDKRVAEARFLTLHMFVHTPTFASMDPDIPHSKNGDIFRCYLCEKAFPKERYLKLHNLQVHLTKTIICKICNREFRSDFWYSQHKCVVPTEVPEPEEEVVEDETNQFPCTVCNRKFARLRFMKSHRHRMHKDVLNEDGTYKSNTDQEKDSPAKADDAEEDSDDNDNDDNYESENETESQKDESKELKEYEKNATHAKDSSINPSDRVLGLNEISTRRSLSRGVPKIQCDFCGDYIEETAYDKHIFMHNKLRLDKSLSKRKSLDSSIEETADKKQVMMKCPVCSKPFKRKYNLNVHISKCHEGVETFDGDTTNTSELNVTADDEEKYLSDSENAQKEPSEIITGQISVVDGNEIYECCDRNFRLKAHFYRHFKIKHPNAVFKPIYIDENGEVNNITKQELIPEKEELYIPNETKTNESKTIDKSTIVTKNEIETTNKDTAVCKTEIETTNKDTAVCKSEIATTDMVTAVLKNEINDNVESETKITQAGRPVRKKRRHRLEKELEVSQPIGKRSSTIKSDRSSKIKTDRKTEKLPATTNKRKITAESDFVDNPKPSKQQKIINQITEDKSIHSDESEDMEATSLHPKRLDLQPISNKNTLRYECHICEKKFKQKCQLRDHFNVHTGDKPYKCDFCNPVRGFTQTSSLYVHFRRVHAVVMKNCVWEVYSKNGECLICSDVFDKHLYMFKHMKDHYVKKEFECHVCNEKFHMSCHYKTHDINPGEMQHLFVDDNLEVDLENVSEAEEELKTTPIENSETVDDKMGSDTDSSNLADKLTGTDENKPSKCTKCKKTFPNKQQLRFHKKSLAHIQKIQSIRKKVSESPVSKIENSVKTDTDTIEDIENGVKAIIKKIRTFKKHHCNICGAAFIKRIHLKKHKRRHKVHKSNIKSKEVIEATKIEDTEMEHVSSNTNSVEKSDDLETTQNVTTLKDPVVSEKVVEPDPTIDFKAQLVDRVPADTEIISITAPNLIKTEETRNSKPSVDSEETFIKPISKLSEFTEPKFDSGCKTDQLGSFDVILKLAESTSDLNKKFLFKQANTSRAINLDIPKCSNNANLNLSESISSQNTVIELPESTITYINPIQSDISLITTDQEQCIREDKININDIPELDFTIEVSTCSEIPSISENRVDLQSNLNVENIIIETNIESNESYLSKVDSNNFYSHLSNDLVIVPISESSLEKSSKVLENLSPLNDLSFLIVEAPSSEIRSDVKICDNSKSVVPKEQYCVQSTSLHTNQLEIHEVVATITTQPQTSVSDYNKYLDVDK